MIICPTKAGAITRLAHISVLNSCIVYDSRVIPKQMQTNMCNWRKDADPMDMLHLDLREICYSEPWVDDHVIADAVSSKVDFFAKSSIS